MADADFFYGLLLALVLVVLPVLRRMTEAWSQTNPVSDAFCFNCGYALRGLKLPHGCPECGRVADPELEVAAARRWFEKEAWKPWKCLFPFGMPLALWHALDDDRSRRIAIRRRRWCLWIPATATAVIVLLSHMLFEIESSVDLVARPISAPTAAPLGRTTGLAFLRPFDRGHHRYEFHNDHVTAPPGCFMNVEGHQWRTIRLRPDSQAWAYALPAAFVSSKFAILGFVIPSIVIWAAVRYHKPGVSWAATLPAASVVAPALGVILWMWMPTLCYVGVEDIVRSGFPAQGRLATGLMYCLLATWVLLCCIAWPVLVFHEHSGRLLRRRAFVSFLSAMLSLATWCALAFLE